MSTALKVSKHTYLSSNAYYIYDWFFFRIQLGGALMLKVPGYNMVERNSKYAPSFAYSLEKGAQSRKSFYYPMCQLGSEHNPTYYNVGKKIIIFMNPRGFLSSAEVPCISLLPLILLI